MEDVWEWEGEWGGRDESKRGLKVKERECKTETGKTGSV